jgi:hypothetical protein
MYSRSFTSFTFGKLILFSLTRKQNLSDLYPFRISFNSDASAAILKVAHTQVLQLSWHMVVIKLCLSVNTASFDSLSVSLENGASSSASFLWVLMLRAAL